MGNKEQLIKEITDEVVKYVPEIMELKFGCKIKFTCFDKKVPNELVYKVSKDDDKKIIVYPTGFINDFFREEDFEILGRDITLEDILITTKKIINNEFEAFFVPYHVIVSEVVIKSSWRLGKPLHEQPFETLHFIRDILK